MRSFHAIANARAETALSLQERIGAIGFNVLRTVVGLRWSTSRDLVDGVELLGAQAAFEQLAFHHRDAPVAQPLSTTTDCFWACTTPALVRTTRPTLIVSVSADRAGLLRTVFEERGLWQ